MQLQISGALWQYWQVSISVLGVVRIVGGGAIMLFQPEEMAAAAWPAIHVGSPTLVRHPGKALA
jgi:hypothetical protein